MLKWRQEMLSFSDTQELSQDGCYGTAQDEQRFLNGKVMWHIGQHAAGPAFWESVAGV